MSLCYFPLSPLSSRKKPPRWTTGPALSSELPPAQFLIPQHLSQQLSPGYILPFRAQMLIEWFIGLFGAISKYSHHCSSVKKRKEKKAILFGISRNLSDPPQRALGCFYCTMFLVLGLLLSHSCTIGLIKQRTIRALSFTGLQVPLNHGAWMADSEPCLGFAKTTQKRWKSWRVFLFIALKCSILGQFWKVYWA